ncbi:hypothetical protein KUTeg_003563 [Tegillarca granosa]|uniref:FYVE-type domain-containing protein n=1 Tax=Tegillarca granosa TaxID=220873 RepID=A0ABQ9FMG5_TEGGR|nr:hypothetical protein KUTeg_003563 [Tegillarca granosa]
MGTLRPVKLEGRDVYPATVEGLQDVFDSNNFVLTKSRWVEDSDANSCVLCKNKFNQLRRKHHCRQCGHVFCNKCCKERIPLPQLGIDDPERAFKVESINGIVELCKDPPGLIKVVEYGGLQTLISKAKDENVAVLNKVATGLNILSTHQPLHKVLADTGAIKALCSMLMKCDLHNEQLIFDGISAVMIFCKLPDLKTKALQDGALDAVLRLCGSTQTNEAISLLAVSTLSLIVEHPDTHAAVIDDTQNVLQRILTLIHSKDEQMQEVSLKTLAHISLGSDWHRHRIVQGGLQDLLEAMCNVLKSDTKNSELLIHVARGIANFSKFRQNADKLMTYLPLIVYKCLKSPDKQLELHGMRTTLYLLSFKPTQTSAELLRGGAGDLLEKMAKIPGLMDTLQTTILTQASDKSKPL